MRDRLLEWPLRLAMLASLVVVWESNHPWAAGLVTLPRSGNGDETLFTTLAGFIAGGTLVYRWYRQFATWRVLLAPVLAYGVSCAIATYDWVRVANIPAESDVVFWGLQYDIRTTWGLWTTTVASYVGMAASAVQLVLDRNGDLRRQRRGPTTP